MERLKCLSENFVFRRIKADADRVLNRFVSRRSDIASPDFLVRTILRFLRVPTSLSGQYCISCEILRFAQNDRERRTQKDKQREVQNDRGRGVFASFLLFQN